MTISATESSVTYACNGVTVAFATGFKFMQASDLICTRITISDGTRLIITEGSYSVTGAGDEAGGTVTFVGAFASDFQIEIARTTAQLQPLDLIDNDGADAETLEDALDRLTMMVQDLDRRLSAALVSASGLSVGNELDVSNYGAVPLYSRLSGGEHLIRRIDWNNNGLHAEALAYEYLSIGLTGFFRQGGFQGAYGVYDETNSALSAATQQQSTTGYPVCVLWNSDDGADLGKWAFSFPATEVMAIGAITDDMGTLSEHIRFTRSGSSAASTQLRVALDANAKRVGNVGAMDFDETAKGTTSGSITFDFSAANCYSITLNGAVTATFTAPAGATTTYIEATQDGTGSRVLTFPAVVKWTAATAAGDKLLSTGASKRDLIVLKWNAAGTAALAQIFKDW